MTYITDKFMAEVVMLPGFPGVGITRADLYALAVECGYSKADADWMAFSNAYRGRGDLTADPDAADMFRRVGA